MTMENDLVTVAWLCKRATDSGQPFSSSLRFYEDAGVGTTSEPLVLQSVALARIQALEAELARKTEALRPFSALVESHDAHIVAYLRTDQPEAASTMTDADIALAYTPNKLPALTDGALRNPVLITWGDFRSARSALEEKTDV